MRRRCGPRFDSTSTGYFRRWWYWRGISRARLDGMHPITESGLDLSRVTCVGGVPRFMFGDVLREVPQWLGSAIRSSEAEHLASELRLAYLAGYMNERRRHPVETMKQSATRRRRKSSRVLPDRERCDERLVIRCLDADERRRVDEPSKSTEQPIDLLRSDRGFRRAARQMRDTDATGRRYASLTIAGSAGPALLFRGPVPRLLV